MRTPPRIVLGFAGGTADCAAVAWLAEALGAEVVALALDVGQDVDLGQLRDRALACGAFRAHAIDARDEFARECVLPWLRAGAADAGASDVEARLHGLVARRLLDLARIEHASAVAHTSGESMDRALEQAAPDVRVISVAAEWARAGVGDPEAYARSRRLPGLSLAAREPHLLVRPVADLARTPEAEAQVELAFDEQGVPTSINGVQLTLVELLESLALIAGQHGIGASDLRPAPAACVLREAYAALDAASGVVRLKLWKGRQEVLASQPYLVNYA